MNPIADVKATDFAKRDKNSQEAPPAQAIGSALRTTSCPMRLRSRMSRFVRPLAFTQA